MMGTMPTQLLTSEQERAFLLEVCELLHVDPAQIPDHDFRIVYRTHYPVSDVIWSEWVVDPRDYRQATGMPTEPPPTRRREEPIESTLLARMLEDRGLDPQTLVHVEATAMLP